MYIACKIVMSLVARHGFPRGRDAQKLSWSGSVHTNWNFECALLLQLHFRYIQTHIQSRTQLVRCSDLWSIIYIFVLLLQVALLPWPSVESPAPYACHKRSVEFMLCLTNPWKWQCHELEKFYIHYGFLHEFGLVVSTFNYPVIYMLISPDYICMTRHL